MATDKKLERKIQVIRKYLKRACTTCSGYVYGDIPSNKFQGACRSYAGHVNYADVIGLTDETIFGGGERGMLFVKDGYYCDNMSRKVLYTERKHHKVSSNLYNQTVMKEMLGELASIDEEPSGWDIAASIFDLGLGILQAVSDVAETQETTKKNNATDIEENSDDIADYMENIETLFNYYQRLENQMRQILNYNENIVLEMEVLKELCNFAKDDIETQESIEEIINICIEVLYENGDIDALYDYSFIKESEKLRKKVNDIYTDLIDCETSSEIEKELANGRKIIKENLIQVKTIRKYLDSVLEMCSE